MNRIRLFSELRSSGLCVTADSIQGPMLDCAVMAEVEGSGGLIRLGQGIKLLGRPYNEADDTFIDVRTARIDGEGSEVRLRLTRDSLTHRRTIKSLGLVSGVASRQVYVPLSELHRIDYLTGADALDASERVMLAEMTPQAGCFI